VIGHSQERILRVLNEQGGATSGWVARALGHKNIRSMGPFCRVDLLTLEKKGLVRRIDDLSPTAWQRTAAGTAAIEEGSL